MPDRKGLKAGVIGHPVSHSLSPDIFGFLARRLKKDLSYFRVDIPQNKLKSEIRRLKESGFLGWNVTIPHKENLRSLLDRLSDEAKSIGAVNVVHHSGGKLKGYNTDVIGIEETLREQRFSVPGKKAVVFGAGGAAKAVAYVLGKLGAKRVWVINRTISRAQTLCDGMNHRFSGTDFRAAKDLLNVLDEIDLYVNATPVGMKGFSKEKLLKLGSPASPRTLAFDLVYCPEKTIFLESARKLRMKRVGGLDMLIWQALATWEIWFGPIGGFIVRRRTKTALKNYLRKKLG